MPVIRASDAVVREPVIAIIADPDPGTAGFGVNLDVFGFKVKTDPVTGIGLECWETLHDTEIFSGSFGLGQAQTFAA